MNDLILENQRLRNLVQFYEKIIKEHMEFLNSYKPEKRGEFSI